MPEMDGVITEVLSCQDEDLYVIGGANSAGQAAMHFSQYAKRVRMLVRGTGQATTRVPASLLFIFIGAQPCTRSATLPGHCGNPSPPLLDVVGVVAA